jgi:hypothetical protein
LERRKADDNSGTAIPHPIEPEGRMIVDSNNSHRLDRIAEALKNPDSQLQAVLARWQDHDFTVRVDGKWRLEGFINFFQSVVETLAAVDGAQPPPLPSQCLDPVQIARFFRIPLDEFAASGIPIGGADTLRRSQDVGISGVAQITGLSCQEVTPRARHLDSIAENLARIADALAPPTPDIVGSPHVAKLLGCTTVWVAELARRGEIPKNCIVPGTGNGKPWKFYRCQIDRWIESR